MNMVQDKVQTGISPLVSRAGLGAQMSGYTMLCIVRMRCRHDKTQLLLSESVLCHST